MDELNLNEKSQLVLKMARDFLAYSQVMPEVLPEKYCYKIACQEDNYADLRQSTLVKIAEKFTIKKVAFDTRRINQEEERNPRGNLQYWHRSEAFISEEDQNKIEIFAKLLNILTEIKQAYGHHQEWHDSYARVLFDNVDRTLRIKQGDSDIYAPQLSYLEQLIFARYRLGMDEIINKSHVELKKILLSKDENLLKRGALPYVSTKDGNSPAPPIQTQAAIVSDGQHNTQESIINAIFGAANTTRKDGERKIERTITITIRDEVME